MKLAKWIKDNGLSYRAVAAKVKKQTRGKLVPAASTVMKHAKGVYEPGKAYARAYRALMS